MNSKKKRELVKAISILLGAMTIGWLLSYFEIINF